MNLLIRPLEENSVLTPFKYLVTVDGTEEIKAAFVDRSLAEDFCLNCPGCKSYYMVECERIGSSKAVSASNGLV